MSETLTFVPRHRKPTQAAEGFPRWRWTVDEIYKAVEIGLIDPDEKFELIGGEMVPMSPEGIPHEVLRTALMMYWGRRCPKHLRFASETSVRLGVADLPEPDFIVFADETPLADVRGGNILLAVEVADSSMAKDLGLKARLYAQRGIREYWVINAPRRSHAVHTSAGKIWLRIDH